jgi:hypothetical protein
MRTGTKFLSSLPPGNTRVQSLKAGLEYMYKSSSLGDYREKKKKEIRKNERLEISR